MDGISFISEIRLGMEFLQSEGGGCNTPPAVVILRKELMEQIFVEFLLCVRHIPKHWGCGINRKCKALTSQSSHSVGLYQCLEYMEPTWPTQPTYEICICYLGLTFHSTHWPGLIHTFRSGINIALRQFSMTTKQYFPYLLSLREVLSKILGT